MSPGFPLDAWLTAENVFLFGFGVGTLWVCIAIYLQIIPDRVSRRRYVWAFYGVGTATMLLGSRVWIPSEGWLMWSRLIAFTVLLLSSGIFFHYVAEKEDIPPPWVVAKRVLLDFVVWFFLR